MKQIQQEILDAAGNKFIQGDTFKMRHRFKLDGSTCTPDDKDPAMSVTRVSNGWLFCCHRCTAMGSIKDDNNSPGMTRQRIENLKKIPLSKVVTKIHLPRDFEPLTKRSFLEKERDFPAIFWLWKYGIVTQEMETYNIGWSKAYQRMIIPLYEYGVLNAEVGEKVTTIAKKLVGWVGRDVNDVTKKERSKSKIPKWLTRSEKGSRRYFTAPGKEDKIVIVEDSISAIKVNLSTDYTTIALLNATVSDDLMRKCRGSKVWLWLDPDMKQESIKTVARMNQLGLDTKIVLTDVDPKEYPEHHINTVIGE